MIRIAACILLIGVSASVLSQSSRWPEGFIVLNNGDTLRGFIKNVDYESRSEQVTFKTSWTSEPVVYTPHDLRMYQIGKTEHYRKSAVRIVLEEYEGIRPVQYTFDKTMFTRRIVQGEASLYRLDYRVRRQERPDIEFETIFYFLGTGKDSLDQLTALNYRKVLADTLGRECDIPDDLYSNFNDTGLSNLVVAYNTCNGSESQIYITPDLRERNWRFGSSAGGVQSDIRNQHPAFIDVPPEEDYGFTVSAFVDLLLNERFAVRGGLAYVQKSAKGSLEHLVDENYDNVGEVLQLESAIQMNQVIVPLSVRYGWADPAFSPYVRVGGYAGFGIGTTTYIDRLNFEHINGENIQFVERRDDVITDHNKFEVGWLVGTGVEFGLGDESALFFEFQITVGRNTLEKTSTSFLSNNTYGVHIGWRW